MHWGVSVLICVTEKASCTRSNCALVTPAQSRATPFTAFKAFCVTCHRFYKPLALLASNATSYPRPTLPHGRWRDLANSQYEKKYWIPLLVKLPSFNIPAVTQLSGSVFQLHLSADLFSFAGDLARPWLIRPAHPHRVSHIATHCHTLPHIAHPHRVSHGIASAGNPEILTLGHQTNGAVSRSAQLSILVPGITPKLVSWLRAIRWARIPEACQPTSSSKIQNRG